MSNASRHRYAYQRLLAVVLILTLSAELIAGQAAKKCMENNEYCQNHWDCCSNSCLSYLYRCVRRYNVYPYPFLGVSHIPTVTLDDILELNFGPQNVAVQNSDVPVTTQRGPVFESRFNGDSNVIGEEQPKVDIVLQEQIAQGQTTTETATVTTAAELEEPCKAIGSKCYRNSECCTQRCHGFLHQCVT